MGTSYVSLGEEIPEDKQTEWVGVTYGFWAADAPLLIWLTAMGEIVDDLPNAEPWLQALRNDWRDAFNGVGCVVTGFDGEPLDQTQREVLFKVVTATTERLLAFGGDYRLAFPSTEGMDLTVSGPRPLELREKVGLIELGANLARLLKGTVKTGEHRPQAWGYAPDRWG